MFYIRSDVPHRRRFDLEQMTDSQAGLQIIILEVMLNKKERWIYFLGYKPQIIADYIFERCVWLVVWRCSKWISKCCVISRL